MTGPSEGVPRHRDPVEGSTAGEADQEELLTVGDVSAWLKVNRRWVYDQVEARRIPHLRLGRRILRFRRGEVMAYLDEQAHPPMMREIPVGLRSGAEELEPLD